MSEEVSVGCLRVMGRTAAAPSRRTPLGRDAGRWARRAARVAGVFVLGVAVGCASRGTKPDAAMRGAPETGPIGDLMTNRDYERLEALAATRSKVDPRQGYRIGPDDLVDIRVPDLMDGGSHVGEQAGSIALPSVREVPVFQHGLRVNSHGSITLPLLGEIAVEGLTATELESEIARRLRAGDILLKPEVNVQLVEYRNGVVAVMGSLERPGLYPITRPGATIADLMWSAGGPSKDSGRVVAFSPEGVGEPIRIDVDMLLQPDGKSARNVNVRVVPGDVISIAPAGSVLVDGWVEKPGSYPVTRGLTLAGAIAAAGGYSFAADRQRVTVKRALGLREQHVFQVDLDAVASGVAPDVPLTDGDVVRLPASTVRVVPWGFWKLTTQLVQIGGSIPLF